MKHDMTQSLLLENSLQSTSTVATAYPNAKGDHRADAPLKVTGNARYTADHAWDNLAHAVLVTSPIACGRVASINAEAARRSPGFLGVVSHENCSELRGLAGRRINANPNEPLEVLSQSNIDVVEGVGVWLAGPEANSNMEPFL